MSVSAFQRLFLAVIYSATFLAAAAGHAQTPSAPPPSKAVPTNPSASPKSPPSDDLAWDDPAATV
jgi:hypothetical protein